MVVFRWRMLALVLVATSTVCACGADHEDRAPSRAPLFSASASSTSTPSASSTAPLPAGTSPASVTPSSTASSTVRLIPPVSAKALAAGLVDIRTIIPDAIVDLRYATSDNFVGVPLYPADARCLVHQTMAPGLTAAANRLRLKGHVLVFWD